MDRAGGTNIAPNKSKGTHTFQNNVCVPVFAAVPAPRNRSSPAERSSVGMPPPESLVVHDGNGEHFAH